MHVDETEDTTEEQQTEQAADTAETDQDNTGGQGDNAETFPREYVEKLRKESGGYRDRAKTAEARVDELSKQLHTALVTATGMLADPSDLEYSADHLTDPAKLTEAIDSLVTAKPHLKARKPVGNVGQGVTGTRDEPFSLIGRLKQTT